MTDSKELKLNTRQQLVVNQISQTLREIYGGGGAGTRDAKHTMAWSEYGYKDVLEFNDHYQMYRRFGIAKAGIKLPPAYCWKTKPKVFEGDEDDIDDGYEGKSKFEMSIKSIFKRYKLWKKLKLVDEYQRVGQYGALIIQIRGIGDDAKWDKPLGNISEQQIVKFIPVFERQLIPATWNEDRNSETYGQPETYNFQESNVQETTGQIQQKVRSETVHASRVIIFAEGADDDSIYGVPANEGGYNDLITMEKIIGAGGEGFWKNASMKTAFSSTNKDAPDPDPQEVDANDAAIADFMEGMDKHLMLGNVDGKVLSASLSDPKEHFGIALMSYSASMEIASKVLVGTQTGRLAADEDGKFTLSNFQSRREDWCSDMVTNVVDWMIAHGVVDDLEYFVQWDDLLAPSDNDKFALGEQVSKVIERMIKVTGDTPIDPKEVAKIMGFAVNEEELIDDKDIIDGDEDIDIEDGE